MMATGCSRADVHPPDAEGIRHSIAPPKVTRSEKCCVAMVARSWVWIGSKLTGPPMRLPRSIYPQKQTFLDPTCASGSHRHRGEARHRKLWNALERSTSPFFSNPLILLKSLVPPLGTNQSKSLRPLRSRPKHNLATN